jgi:hypothetical protein
LGRGPRRPCCHDGALGGGHRSGKEKSNWDLLRDIAKEYFPEAKERYFWATQDCMSLDKRPYIGPYSKNTPDLFVATGFGKWGMTGSMLSAMILSDLVQEKNNEYSTVFSPSRNMLKPQLISNLGHALVGIGRIGGKRCSHMGCVLQWNKEEQTWECPCHGSRFSADGKVLDNPELYDDPVKRIEEIEYLLQSTWGFPENKASHSYWNKIKGCTCPKDDNFFAFGTGVRYYNRNCIWHGEK